MLRNLFDFLKPASPDAKIHIPAIQGTGGDPMAYARSALRRRPTTHYPYEQPPQNGMWVRYGNSTGIITNLHPHDVYNVMLVDQKGENLQAIKVNGSELRQAWWEEIPPGRRPPLDEAGTSGYHPRPRQ